MTVKLNIKDPNKRELHTWWKKFLDEVSEEHGCPYVYCVNEKLRTQNARLNEWGEIIFKRKMDRFKFLLRWS